MQVRSILEKSAEADAEADEETEEAEEFGSPQETLPTELLTGRVDTEQEQMLLPRPLTPVAHTLEFERHGQPMDARARGTRRKYRPGQNPHPILPVRFCR